MSGSKRESSGVSFEEQATKKGRLGSTAIQKEVKRIKDEISEKRGSRATLLPQMLLLTNNVDATALPQVLSVLQSEFNELTSGIQELEKTKNILLTTSLRRSVSASSLNAGNLFTARGGMKIHNRDSGVARHPLFLAVVKSTAEDTWDEKAKQISQCLSEKETDQLGAFTAKVSLERWADLLRKISGLRATNQTSTTTETNNLLGRESYYSEQLARSLSVFCSQCNLPFLFSHQLTCGVASTGGEDTADIAAFHIQASGQTILLGLDEVNKQPDYNAKWQLCGYMSEAYGSSLIEDNRNISFGLTIDHVNFQLYGLLWSKNSTEDMPLLEHSLLCVEPIRQDDSSVLMTYFLCLFVLTLPSVKSGVSLDDFCPLVPGAVKKNPKVFFQNIEGPQRALKVFDYGPARDGDRKPNENAIMVAHKSSFDVEILKEEPAKCKVSVLAIPWFEGDHTPKYPEQIALLCDQLQRLHDGKMKHADVLCQNVVFGVHEDIPTTYLIDFDFAHLRIYPLSWNTSFAERHPEAKGNSEVDSSHDVYAAIAILCTYFGLNDNEGKELYEEFSYGPFTSEKHPELLSDWQNASASAVAKWIREKKGRLVSANGKVVATPVATGSPPENAKKGKRKE
jgi:hypothetical protein